MWLVLLFICLIVVDIALSFWKALACMLVFNWFAPVIYPGLVATYMQTLAAILLLSAYRHMNTKNKNNITKEEIIESIATQITSPLLMVIIFGLLYLGCVAPFK